MAELPEHRVPWLDAWERVASLPPLLLADGSGPALQPTRVRVARDDGALHVRFDCADRDVSATLVARDAPLYEEEVVEVFLAPGSEDPQRYFELEVNPLGALFDAVVDNPGGRRATLSVDRSWDCPGLAWGARVHRDGWSAWLAIPWAAVAPAGSLPRVWRANFHRIERTRGAPAEFSSWSPTLTRPADFHKPARFGRLVL